MEEKKKDARLGAQGQDLTEGNEENEGEGLFAFFSLGFIVAAVYYVLDASALQESR